MERLLSLFRFIHSPTNRYCLGPGSLIDFSTAESEDYAWWNLLHNVMYGVATPVVAPAPIENLTKT
jgi:hypothetical protein